MISARLYGAYLNAYNLGLCNQMFCAAAAIALAARNHDHAVFGIGRDQQPYRENVLRNLSEQSGNIPWKYYAELRFRYDPIPYLPNLCLEGYFQSYKYFDDQGDLIRQIFSIDDATNAYITKTYEHILCEETVAIHVRRGDYLQLPQYHPVCSMKYYTDALEHLPKNIHRVFFSDDIDWCKHSFGTGNTYHFIHEKDYIDLWLMSLCSHNIIANSTFSWWGAWLNHNPNKRVFAPKIWFGSAYLDQVPDMDADMIPESWMRL